MVGSGLPRVPFPNGGRGSGGRGNPKSEQLTQHGMEKEVGQAPGLNANATQPFLTHFSQSPLQYFLKSANILSSDLYDITAIVCRRLKRIGCS